jgi:hypothetical protein
MCEKSFNRRVLASLIPSLREFSGYRSYSIVDMGDGTATSISVFDTREQAEDATERAWDIVLRTLSDLLPNPPEVTIGEILSEDRK